MTRCLSEQALLQCHTGEGAEADLAHLGECPACAGRLTALAADLALITQALEAEPLRRRPVEAPAFSGWRLAVSGMALAVAFMVGWSLRAAAPIQSGNGARIARHEPAAPAQPIQLSSLEPGAPAPAAYAAYVQGAFESDLCSEPDDPLEPGCL
jgi:hypothetical protein